MFSSAVSSAPSGDLDIGELDDAYYSGLDGHQQDWKESNPGDDNFKVCGCLSLLELNSQLRVIRPAGTLYGIKVTEG